MTAVVSNRDKVTFSEIANYYHSNKLLFGIKYFKNWILERLASSVPVPSWRAKLHRMRGVNIGENVYVGYDVVFDRIHPELITVGDYAEIGDRCILSAHSRGSLTTRQAYPRSYGSHNNRTWSFCKSGMYNHSGSRNWRKLHNRYRIRSYP